MRAKKQGHSDELNWKRLLLRLETCSSTDGLDVGEDEQISIRRRARKLRNVRFLTTPWARLT